MTLSDEYRRYRKFIRGRAELSIWMAVAMFAAFFLVSFLFSGELAHQRRVEGLIGAASAIFVMALWLGGYLAYVIWMRRRASRRLRRERQTGTLCTFRQEFVGTDFHVEAIERAYGDLTGYCGHHVKRHDVLVKLGFYPESFEDLFDQRCREVGELSAVLERQAQLLPLNTVDAYVRFLSALEDMKRSS